MTEEFISKINDIIENKIKKEYDFPREKLDDYKQMLISLSTHMYNDTLTSLIDSDATTINNLIFRDDLTKIFNFLKDKLDNKYYLKCRLLSFIFLKINNITIKIGPGGPGGPRGGPRGGPGGGGGGGGGGGVEPSEKTRNNIMLNTVIAGLLFIEPEDGGGDEDNGDEDNGDDGEGGGEDNGDEDNGGDGEGGGEDNGDEGDGGEGDVPPSGGEGGGGGGGGDGGEGDVPGGGSAPHDGRRINL
jgi:hypothetical protein